MRLYYLAGLKIISLKLSSPKVTIHLKKKMKYLYIFIFIGIITSLSATAQNAKRARDYGIPFDGTPGKFNAITDVDSVTVGQVTLIEGDGALVQGKGPVRTGVTVILPRGKTFAPVYANWYTLNGNGDMTGTHWLTESGFLETPILITNTGSVGTVRDAAWQWMNDHHYYTPFYTITGMHIPLLQKLTMEFLMTSMVVT